MNRVISQELINQESQKMKINDIEEKIDIRIKAMKSKYPSEEHFKSMLEKKKTTEEDLKESVKSKIHVDEYLEMKGVLNPKVPEDELRTYYEKNKSNFKRNETIRARHILIMIKEDASPEEKEQERAKAEGIRKEIMEGKDFAEMAKKYSQDGRVETGGDLGYISKGYMPSEFDTAAFALEKETMSKVVETQHGFHIIKVEDRKPGGIAPYEDVKDFIMKYLQEQLTKERLSSHVRELRSKAKLEIYLKE
jgi:parvulin-like peptidyl-prolyl isomerase